MTQAPDENKADTSPPATEDATTVSSAAENAHERQHPVSPTTQEAEQSQSNAAAKLASVPPSTDGNGPVGPTDGTGVTSSAAGENDGPSDAQKDAVAATANTGESGGAEPPKRKRVRRGGWDTPAATTPAAPAAPVNPLQVRPAQAGNLAVSTSAH